MSRPMCKQCGEMPVRNTLADYCSVECAKVWRNANLRAQYRQKMANRPLKMCSQCLVAPTQSQHRLCLYCEDCKAKSVCRVRRKVARRRNYGVDQSQYGEMLVAQSGCCAICCVDFEDFDDLPRGHGSRKNVPYVDHCHETGEVRGLLCQQCNFDVGVVEKLQRQGRLERVLTYIAARAMKVVEDGA